MRKKILALTMTLVLALGLAACGNKAAGSDSGNRTAGRGNSSNADALKDRAADKSSEADEAENTLSDWYESDERSKLEDLINNMFSGQGLTFSVEVEEPDVIIYNYQYTEQLAVTEALKSGLAQGVDSAAETVISDIQNYRDTYDIPVNVIRMVYRNADGSVIYEMDVTEDYEPGEVSADPANPGAYADLEEWMESDEAAQMVELTNQMIASNGMSVDFYADGDTFVYEYYLNDETYESMGLANYSDDQMQTFVDTVVESQRASLETIFSDFENNYGLILDSVRVVFCTADGTELGSSDIENE
ncbi:MAG: DUF4854 domain-containing protein [Muribaculum sp.]|nr:DUF4854 domain-containing protein [Muribaculum sp.]